MNADKKIWFRQITRRFWLPISWEGWLLYAVCIGGLFLVVHLNGGTMRQSIQLKKHWYVLLEMLVPVILFYVLSRGRVRR